MIPTNNHESRGGARVRLIVLHTSEGARDVVSLGHFFQTTPNQVSYHVAFDDNSMEQYVDYDQAAWAIMSGNVISDNGCFCGFAAWDRAEWLRHPTMLRLGAQWVAQRCQARGIPMRRLGMSEVRDAIRDPHHPGGVIMHRDYTLATGQGTHTDCGDGFPWDVILSSAPTLSTNGGNEMAWRLAATPVKAGSKVGDHPDGSWPAFEDTITVRSVDSAIMAVWGYGGAWVQEAWFGPSGVHIIDPKHPVYVNQFDAQVWAVPAGSRFLVVRYASPAGGSVGPV